MTLSRLDNPYQSCGVVVEAGVGIGRIQLFDWSRQNFADSEKGEWQHVDKVEASLSDKILSDKGHQR